MCSFWGIWFVLFVFFVVGEIGDDLVIDGNGIEGIVWCIKKDKNRK